MCVVSVSLSSHHRLFEKAKQGKKKKKNREWKEMGRAPCCDKANVKKGPWSPEEDRKLKDYIDNHGTGGNWISLPHKAGLKRCGKSCRLRWLNYLRPNLKHGDFSDDEDRIICNLFATIGSRWSIIAAQLPGRTDNDIKNYWNTKLKKKILAFPPKHKSLRSMQIHLPQKQTLEPHSHPFFFSSFDTNTISRSHNLEGDSMISSLLFNPSNDISNVLSSSIIQECPSGSNMLAFGKDQNCSSLELNHGKGINFDLGQINAGEQLGFENYLFGGLEETQKLFLYEAPPLLEFNNNGVAISNYEDMKPLLGCNFTYTANGDAINASSKAPTSQEKLLF